MLTKLIAAAALLIAGAAQAESQPAMNAKDPAAFHASLKEMGYSPDPMDIKAENASTAITADGSRYWVVLGGCTNKQDCSYLVLGSSFNDVIGPPAEWVARQNKDFDLIKVWVNDNNQLTYSSSVLTDGLTRAQFRAFVDSLVRSEAVLGQEATQAKLAK